MRASTRLLILAAGMAALSQVSLGYYHWVFFNGGAAPYTPTPAKFDLSALTNKTVSFFISDQPPSVYMAGDTYDKVASQIQAAAAIWDGVSSSDIRLQFGGITTVGGPELTPGIDVVFDDDMPPGLLAKTRLSFETTLYNAGNASFVRILRSRVQLHSDLTLYQQASYSDKFFLTIVHEFGHALGLQHTLTSSVMSTQLTRATTKAAPLGPDDIAGVSLLYPRQAFLDGTGTISGNVLQSGNGVNLASVVALSPSTGIAVSGMTNPDGSYTISGIPPGQYLVYTLPLPAPVNGEGTPADIVAPVDSQGDLFGANSSFGGLFFGATRDWTQSAPVSVSAGAVSGSINFDTQYRAAPAIPVVETYTYQNGQEAVGSPIQSGAASYLILNAPGTLVGTTKGNQLAAGLNMSVIGGPATLRANSLAPYPYTAGFDWAIVDPGAVTVSTPTAIAVTVDNDLYVLPAAFTVFPSAPPTVSSALGAADSSGNVTIAGTNLAKSRVMFDGAPATVLQTNPDGSLTVKAPIATANRQASVVALSSDGQTSSQALGTAAPAVFTYSGLVNPSIKVNPQSLLPGTDAMVEILGFNAVFVDGQVTVGFGSSDISVRQIWVTNAGRMLVNVSVSASAQAGTVPVTVACGLQLVTLGATVQVQAANAQQMSLNVPITNQVTGLAGIPVGGTALIRTTGLPSDLTGWILTVNNQKVSYQIAASGVLQAQVPGVSDIGTAVVQLTSPSGAVIPPVVMQIDPPPPVITAVTSAAGSSLIDPAHPVPVHALDSVTLTVVGLADSQGNVATGAINVVMGGVAYAPSSVTPSPVPGAMNIQFTVGAAVTPGTVPLAVGINTRLSSPVILTIQGS